MTMKSGTNQYHGTGFDYFVNEFLNAGDPFTVNSDGTGKERPRNRRNDFGGTLGGPVIIPKLYNGKNKTFFFFAYEEYLESNQLTFSDTVPTAAFRNGDFSAISANGTCSLCAALRDSDHAIGRRRFGPPHVRQRDLRSKYTRHQCRQWFGLRQSVSRQYHSREPFLCEFVGVSSLVSPAAELQSHQQLQRQHSKPSIHGHTVHKDRSDYLFQGQAVVLLVEDQHREPESRLPTETRMACRRRSEATAARSFPAIPRG